MFERKRTLLAVAAAILFPILSFAAQPAPAFLLRRGVIVDPSRGTAYIAKPNGTIDAVDLASGRTQWTSEAAALPLAIDEGLLIAQVEEKPAPTERLIVAVLDTGTGRKMSEASIDLPDGVRGLVKDEKREAFRVMAELNGDGMLVSWLHQELLTRKIASEPELPEARVFAGSARVQPRVGKMEAIADGAVHEIPEKWTRYGTLPAPPWRSGDVSARTEGGRGGPLTLKRTGTAGGRALTLHSTDTPHGLPDRLLSPRAIVAVPSADQRHLLASERVGEGGVDDPEYRWLIVAMDTGERATELRRDFSAARFFVFGDSVILESPPHGYLRGEAFVNEPLEIHAVRSSTGFTKWEIELRDLAYRGFVPPAR